MTREALDRTFFELLRLKVVEFGYLPDKRAMANEAAYVAAKQALITANKQVIEIYGVGAAEAREGKTVCKIVINRKTSAGGTLGGWPVVMHEPYKDVNNLDKFRKLQYPSKSENVIYEVRTMADTAKYDRILSETVTAALGNRKYSKTVSDNNGTMDGQPVLWTKTGEVDTSATVLIERLFTYTVLDVWLEDFTLLRDNIVPLTTITIGFPAGEEPSAPELTDPIEFEYNPAP